ncbi:MAG TPA: inositol monophosphatase family protein, partial [Candidatus Hydrogenedentes bacterium]|nr:inositol monophosphatase family protein [Candidatus Hydrogenedentota bacterium]
MNEAESARRATGSAARKVAPLPQKFLLELAEEIRGVVEPLARNMRGSSEADGIAQSGDVTFPLDRVAEKTLLAFLRRSGLPLAYYSEDAGYSTFSTEKPQYLLIVDPIDGSRAARSGFEGCVVSIATTRVIERPTMADVDNACVAEIMGNRVFYAERGKGVKILVDGHTRRPKLSENQNLDQMRWTMTVPGRPPSLIFTTVYKLLEQSSLRGGFFACNSTAFSLTRLLTNQLDACVDIANRFFRDMPDKARPYFERAG